MCQFCFNSDNSKQKFRLFDINPIPLIALFKSRRCFDTLLESEKSSDVLLNKVGLYIFCLEVYYNFELNSLCKFNSPIK